MATTFDVIFLGVQSDMDTVDGDKVAENAAVLEGLTIGTPADPLHGRIQTLSPGTTGYSGGANAKAYEPDQANESFRINGGADQSYDMGMAFGATLTYADGTTANITAIVFQDHDGNTYLAPHLSYNADQAAIEAKPIVAITLGNAVYSDGVEDGWGLTADRYDATFAEPGPVDGTAGGEVMTDGYADADGDVIGSDGDTIYGWDGDDEIQGGAGDDTIGGWWQEGGNDTIHGDAGNDVLNGGTGDDTLIGGTGDDTLTGAPGSDRLFGESGSDQFWITDDHEADTIVGGDEGGDTDLIAFANHVSTEGVEVTFTGDEAGVYDYVATTGAGSFSEVEQIIGTAYADAVDASASGADQTLYGRGGDDRIGGGSGDDLVTGDAGADTLSGGAGDDTLFAGSESNPDPAPDMVGYWTFASSSTPEDDLAAPDNDMVFMGGADVAPGSGQLALDGSGDYAVIADDPSYDLDAATVTMSFTLDRLTALTGLFGKDAYGNAVGDFSVWVEPDGAVVVRWQDDTDSYYVNSGAGAVTTGVEHSVQVSLDYDTGTIELYVDGVVEDSGSAPGVTLDGNDNPWVVGARGWSSTRGTSDTVGDELDGTITAFAIYDGAYTPAEIAAPAGGQDAIDGGAGDDRIHGDAGADILSGGDGADTVYLYDFFGADTISGGEGGDDDDRLDAGNVSMPLTVIYTGGERGTISDGANIATFTGIEAVETGFDADIVDATGAGGAGIRVYTGYGDDTVTGGAGDDRLSTGTGDDLVTAGAGSDTINADYGDDVVSAGDGDDTIWAGFGNDAVHGDGGDDYIYGGYGNDTLTGGAGDDEIGVGRNDDIAYGGGGADRFFFEHDMGSNTIVGGETGTDADILDFTLLYNAPIDVAFSGDEAGTAHDPYGDIGFTEIEVIWGSGFDDVVDAGLDGSGIEMWGFAGDDALTGGSGDDTIVGGLGADMLAGGHGDDTFVFEVGFGTDTVTGGETGEVAGDTLDAAALKDDLTVVISATGAGTLSDGTDTVTFSQIENLTLGSGADVVSAAGDGDGVGVEAGDGDDTIWGGTGGDTLTGGAGADEIFGNAGADEIAGGDGADVLGGNAGDDTISGGAGDDTIAGGAGDDTIAGGDGNDMFAFSDGDGADIITDFDLADDDLDGLTNDQLDLSALTDSDGNPVNVWDIAVSDTAGDGSGDAILVFPNGESVTLTDVDPAALDAAMMQAMGIPCLAAGTLVDTPDGARPVERLRPGDLVTTKHGRAMAVVWTASRRLDGAALATQPGLRPVRIRAGALGNRRDLLVSPQHRIALGPGGVPSGFAPARWLAADGDGRFRIARGRRDVTYVHLLLPRHGLIRAEGAWVESFYPGPQGLAALDAAARADLFRRVPALAGIRTKPDADRAYGPLALAEIRRRDLARFIDLPARARASRTVADAALPSRPAAAGPGPDSAGAAGRRL